MSPNQEGYWTRSSQLRQRASAFAAAFLDLSNNPPEKLLSEHFVSSNPRITEHGPAWATSKLPFLGKTFTGKDGCVQYFSLLADTLEFLPSKDTFPQPQGIVVDAEAVGPDEEADRQGRGRGVVSLVGRAVFKSVRTGKSWEEQFAYRLSGFDDEGKIGHWEVWADPLSAWMAVEGRDVP